MAGGFNAAAVTTGMLNPECLRQGLCLQGLRSSSSRRKRAFGEHATGLPQHAPLAAVHARCTMQHKAWRVCGFLPAFWALS